MATAYAALLSLLHNLDLIQNHPRHTFSFDINQIRRLHHTVLCLIYFMERCHSCRVEALEKRIARAAHAAEDVIESHVVDQIRGGSTLDGKRTSRFLLDLQKVIEGMEFVRRKASKVAEAQSEFEVEKPTHWEAATSSTPAPTSQKNSNTMVGLDGVLLQLLDMLTNGVPSSLRVIPIVGMAGTGKTALARNAFQHPLIMHYFDVCLWATISQQYSVEDILSELVSCLRKSCSRTVDELGEELYKSLRGRRYLIVLDDMWSVQVWDKIKFFFPDTSNGSRIVVTTRHSQLVAKHLSYSYMELGLCDGVLLNLLYMLTNGEPSNQQVIPIVGMAGIGKTTLATKAFQHSYIARYFDVCLWATISQQYSVEKILLELVSCLRNSSRRTVDELGEELYKSLYARRYLIVLDDMWSVEAWDGIKNFFPDTGNGSRIVVTSRDSHVAHLLESSCLTMSFLDEDNSQDLFFQKAFAEQVCPPELEEIGKKIVAKCKGLPLAIVVVGGYLRQSSKTLEHWEKVANHNMNSILSSAENERCLNILYLSYSNLPVHLKPCFLFMGVFPKDDRICVPDILQLWIAEGFIQPPWCECGSLEDIAMAYLLDLIDRNLILVFAHGLEGKLRECKIHDLVREFCIKIAKEEEFFDVLDTARARIMNRERRVVINHEQAVPEVNHEPQRSAPRVRSLICERGRLPLEWKLLRVVRKVNRAFANEVNFQQVNLGYLNIVLDYKSYQSLYIIPSSISLLWNLQTLKITGVYLSMIAPYEIWEMSQLRHIEVDSLCLDDPLPMDDSSDEEANDMVLRNLQTLKEVKNLRLSEEVCRRIPNIQELWLLYYDEARLYYCPHNLGCFHNLDTLVCQFRRDPKWHDFALSLTFPSSLKSLWFSGSRLDWEELTMVVGSLPHLEQLVLKSDAVIGSEWNPVEGGFPRLKGIYIQDCDDLVYWNADGSHFPVLEIVQLSHLSKLDELPSGFGEIPTLQSIELQFCSVASTFSAMKRLAEQKELGNEDLRVSVHLRGDEETVESFKQMTQEQGITAEIHFYAKARTL